MNGKIQKFDIGMTLDEKLRELIDERGMTRGAALALIDSALKEWRESKTVFAVRRGCIEIREIAVEEVNTLDCVFKTEAEAILYRAEVIRQFNKE